MGSIWNGGTAEELSNLATKAVKHGIRHFDTAEVYETEARLAAGLKASGIERNEVFITTKLWNTHHHPDHVDKSCKESLERLELSFIDLYLMHYPLAWTANSTKDAPVIDTKVSILDTWKAMENLVDKGLVKQIGVSNFNPNQMAELVAKARIKPVINQMEFHPCVSGGRELLIAAKKEGIVLCKFENLIII